MQLSQCDTRTVYHTRLPIFVAQHGIYDTASETYYLYLSVAIALIAMAFGGIHCAAWNFEFSSYAEKIIWRTSSSLIVLIPCLFFTYMLPLWLVVRIWGAGSTSGIFFRIVGSGHRAMTKVIPLYLLARVILLLEAFITLRNLPEGAYVMVKWSKYIPHI